MIRKVEKYIAHNQLLNKDEKVIVGVSGGADSVALLDILFKLGYNCIVAHCNFHLRDEESNRDARFVENLCKKYNLTYNSIDFDTVGYASGKNISIEMAARELRYNWFEELRIKNNAAYIAVAHHQDDSIETIILNLTRGTGIRGLTGISAKNGYIIRPFLNVSRNEIEDYIAQNGLSYITDRTNLEDIYTRNKIRLNIIPLLEAINPSVKDAITRTANHLQQVENIYNQYIHSAQSNVMSGHEIDINLLLQYQEPKAILFEILSGYGFNSSTVDDLYNVINDQSGKTFYSSTNYKLLKDREKLIIKKIESSSDNSVYTIDEGNTIVTSPIRLKVETIDKDDNFKLEKNKHKLYLDAKKITFPLTIRHWKQGDWFIPFGMKGKKKISDYFTDNKISLFEKEDTWLLCSGENIIWIIGHRSDNRYKITPSTQTVLEITHLQD